MTRIEQQIEAVPNIIDEEEDGDSNDDIKEAILEPSTTELKELETEIISNGNESDLLLAQSILIDKPEKSGGTKNNNLVSSNEPLTIYLKEVKNIKLLTAGEISDLFANWQKSKNDLDKEKIIKNYLFLVISVAKKYLIPGVNEQKFNDLINAGNLGLLEALEKFDITKGFKFNTYACWWIRREILEVIKKDHLVNFPKRKVDALFQYAKYRNEVMKEYGMNHNEAITDEIIKAIGKTSGFTEEKVRKSERELWLYNQKLLPLELPKLDDIDTDILKVSDYIHDEQKSVSDELDLKNLNQKILAALETGFNNQQKQVIINRFGLNGEDEKTLEEVGKIMGLTRERIRQIEVAALVKLRKRLKITK